jgi:hypothetical protein
MKKLLVIGSMITLMGCAPESTVNTVYRDVPAPQATNQDKVDAIISDENSHRFQNGTALLSEGLVCKLYTISGGSTILAGGSTLTGKVLVATYTYKGEFNQANSSINDGMNVLPSGLRAIYKNMYFLSCEGQIVVTESNYYEFSLNSDDASLLYVGGSLVINNDGAHGATVKSGTKYLRKGVNAFKLEYAQSGSGNQALILTSGGALVDRMYFYR